MRRSLIFRVPFTGSFLGAQLRGSALRHRLDRHRAADLDLHEQPDRRHVRHRASSTILPAVSYSGMIDPVSSLAGHRRLRRPDLSDDAFHHDFPRDLLQGRSASAISAASFLPLALALPVLLGASVLLLEEAGELMRASNILNLGVKELRGLCADRDAAGPDRLRLHASPSMRRSRGGAGDAEQRADSDRRRGPLADRGTRSSRPSRLPISRGRS